jgi:hypothetical protein
VGEDIAKSELDGYAATGKLISNKLGGGQAGHPHPQ